MKSDGVKITPGAQAVLDKAGVAPAELLQRHEHGDPGHTSHIARRIVTAFEYTLPTGGRVWVLSEAGQVPMILLPTDY